MGCVYLFGQKIENSDELITALRAIIECKRMYPYTSPDYHLMPFESALRFEDIYSTTIPSYLDDDRFYTALLTPISFFFRNYTWVDMINTSYSLHFLNLIQHIFDYGPTINAAHCIYYYLYNDPSVVDMLRIITENNKTKTGTLVLYKELTDFGYNATKDHGKGIRNYALTFLNNPKLKLLGITINKRKDNIEKGERFNGRYIINMHQIPLLLLFFDLYNTRQPRKPNSDLPEKKGALYSITSYAKVINQIKKGNLLPSLLWSSAENVALSPLSSPENESSESYTLINTLGLKYKLSELFNYNKLNLLKRYYDVYTSDETINLLQLCFPLDKSEIVDIINSVFHSKLLEKGLNSSLYLDFFMPFDIHFRHRIFNYIQAAERNSITLEGIIKECFAVLRLSFIHSTAIEKDLYSFMTSGKNNLDIHDIKSLEAIIINDLLNNSHEYSLYDRTFYPQYFAKGNFVLDELDIHIKKIKDDKINIADLSYWDFFKKYIFT